MKCPKCGYLGFESGDRCRNCGYDFSLAAPDLPPLDFTLDREVEQPSAAVDLDRFIGESTPAGADTDLPLFLPSQAEAPARPASVRAAVPAGAASGADDAPLISSTPARPRAPLGVRRATPEVTRAARPRMSKPSAALEDTLFESPPAAIVGHAGRPRGTAGTQDETLASPLSRIMAALVDASLLSALDAVVLYFTLRLCGLATADIFQLPLLPFTAFLLLLNGGYFVAFTTVGGQSIGKMALGIKVITQEDGSVPVGRATLRTLAYLVSALPFGVGLLPGIMSADRLALHDRLAHTRVVRPS